MLELRIQSRQASSFWCGASNREQELVTCGRIMMLVGS